MTEKTIERGTVSVEVICDDGQWHTEGLDVESLCHEMVELTLEGASNDASQAVEVAISLSDDAAMQELNRRFRGVDAPTNVLAFPDPDGNGHLGDLAFAYETVRHEALAQGKSFDHHFRHLIVHGVLHLLGYDHISDSDAARMEAEELRILAKIDVPDPYAGDHVEV